MAGKEHQVGVIGYGLSAKVFQIPFILASKGFERQLDPAIDSTKLCEYRRLIFTPDGEMGTKVFWELGDFRSYSILSIEVIPC
ncbi:hypothetical protein ASPWEDRAFT_177400 [Aspergillus wentii DTO 134E9]|uniref:Uncharacterized protein n=1 Tax=Aspergillus wentii DTO 134E9 TaxID=1073089 RepID=A0A1L9R408_ASPWE|nr:uncharacterized protein ASPWEDRAFT_177400 [Aspergillus wentii DTO 134E9]KAI9926946.1 hypothetical protein MW887_003324 [Aspergillus wentii]OJJ29659.1 hypothetical protein ASPWEDRAFT_177400 [Aspergillus wentii DTO 134E9]